ncbi:MAG TPA: isoprenyl transferase [Bryobacterales bacterium]|nr:isoprenyl transferase [Bryobacterales bacterium]
MEKFFNAVKPGSREARLAAEIDPARLPRHIAIIMDGNGRWAKRRRLPRVAGHRAGVRPVRETIESCAQLGVGWLTLYAFSVENWKRPRAEVETLWHLLRHSLTRELPELKRNGVRLQVIGRIDELPEEVQRDLDSAMLETAANTGLQLTIALNYGGRTELVDALNAIVERERRRGSSGLPITEETIAANLYTAGMPDPDLLIRTSGEMRVSNFLLWQIAYSEIWVTEKMWPDFRRADLMEAILDYQKRERRYGGLAEPAAAEDLVPVAAGSRADRVPHP